MARLNLILFLCALLLAAGCGKSAEERAVEKQIEKATGADADVDLSKKGMKIAGKTEGGKYTVTTGDKTEIPEDFPSDVFIYRPSKAVMAMKVPEGYSIALSTEDDRSKVVNTYKREMKAEGWSEKATMNMGPQSVLVYEKDGRNANISIGPSGEAVQISLVVSVE